MARTVDTIFQEMISNKVADTNLSGLTSNSKVAIWRLIYYIAAVSMALHEQAWDLFKNDLETIRDDSQIGTKGWLRDQLLKFQYSSTDPQAITLDNFVPKYPVIDEDLQIITRASVVNGSNGRVSVKVAKDEPPVQLTTAEETALSTYLDDIAFAGTEIDIVNKVADKIKVTGTVYYDGQYVSTIQSSVETALTNLFKNLSSAENFGGDIKENDIIDAVQAVEGVNDFIISTWEGRTDAGTYSALSRKYTSSSGYIVEDTSPNDFANTLTYTVGA